MNDVSSLEYADEPATGNLLEQVPAIMRDRRWWLVAPIVLGALAALGAVLVIPPVYQSSAVMLVTSSQLPQAVLGETGPDQVQRRIARIQEQVTSRPSLLSMIEQHGLYSAERRSESLSELIERMRKAITVTPVMEAGVMGAGREDSAVAFQLSFEYAEAVAAQAVTQDLMDRILELDYSGNLEQATGTAQFLSEQAAELEQRIAELQGRISSIKAQNGMVLGSSGLVVGGDPMSYDLQIAALQRDNASLLAQKNIARGSDERSPLVAQAEADLAAARAVYAESHPDVVFAKQRLAEARQLARQNIDKIPLEAVDQHIANNNSQIAALRAAKERAQAQVSSRMAAQARGPLVQQEITELEQELSVLNTQYGVVQDQLLAARAGVRAEDEQMSERLVVVDPPVVPDTPVRPNRLLIAALGLGGGLGLGLLLAFAVELFLRPIRDPKTLQAVTGSAPLAVVPVIEPLVRARSKWWGSLAFWRRAPA